MIRLVCVIGAAALIVCNAQAQSWFGLGSQSSDASVVLTGSYRLLGQSSSRQGTFQEKPPDFARAEFTPTMIFFGIPVSATLLYSTEQRDIRQEINAFSLNLDPEMLQRIVEQRAYRALEQFMASDSGALVQQVSSAVDSLQTVSGEVTGRIEQYKKLEEMRATSGGSPLDYADALETLGLMSSVEKVMMWLPKVGIGTIFPTLTPLTVSGTRVEGTSIEWNPGKVFFISAVKGTTQRPLARADGLRIDTTIYNNIDNADFGRSLTGGRVGIGAKDGPHLMLTGVYTTDNLSSAPIIDSLSSSTPQRNVLASMDFRVEPIKGIWTIDAEIAGSITVGDLNAPKFSTDQLPKFLLDLIDSSSSAFADWSGIASTALQIPSSGTRLSGSLRRIGTGYRALGVPNMRVDVLRYDAKLDQSLFKRQLTLGVFARRDQDNLIPLKRATTLTTSMGATMNVMVRKLPYVRLSYMPYVQEADATDTAYAFANRTTMWTAASGYSYRIGEISASTHLTYSLQTSATSNANNDYSVISASGSQSLAFAFPLSLTVGLGLIQQASGSAEADATIVTGDGSFAYSFDDVLSANGGLTLALDRTYGNRVGYSLGITAHFEDIADVDLRAERSIFDERFTPAVLGGSYQESVFRVVVSKSW